MKTKKSSLWSKLKHFYRRKFGKKIINDKPIDPVLAHFFSILGTKEAISRIEVIKQHIKNNGG
jgi:hypothetical protein